MSVEIAIGIGCRKDISAEAIVRVVRQALALAPEGRPVGLHTSGRKSEDNALPLAAAALGLDLHFHAEHSLREVAPRVVSHSERVERLMGVGSLAEAAALRGAGAEARIVVPKLSAEGVSCAIAATGGAA